MPPPGGSPDWGIPYVVQCSPSAQSMCAAQPARNSLRRSFCAACWAEFFLYKKWVGGRSSLREVSAGQGVKSQPPPLCALKKMGIQGEPAPLGRCSRAEPLRSSPPLIIKSPGMEPGLLMVLCFSPPSPDGSDQAGQRRLRRSCGCRQRRPWRCPGVRRPCLRQWRQPSGQSFLRERPWSQRPDRKSVV